MSPLHATILLLVVAAAMFVSYVAGRRNAAAAAAAAAKQPEPMKAWCVDRPSGTLVVIGTRADAESKAGVMRAAGKEELMLSGPYEFTIAVKP